MFELFCRRRSLAQDGIFQGATDWCSHILPGVDDGIVAIDESMKILSYAELLGIRHWWCTPHVSRIHPKTKEKLLSSFDNLCEAYQGVITLHLAAVYMLDDIPEYRLKHSDLLKVSANILMIDGINVSDFSHLKLSLKEILSAGYRPLLMHPERYAYLHEIDYDDLYEMGVLFQLDLGSVAGCYDKTVQCKAEYILFKGWYRTAGSGCCSLDTLVSLYSRPEVKRKVIEQIKPIVKNISF